MQSLLFNFLDELLYRFHTEFFVACELEVTRIDRDAWKAEAVGCVRIEGLEGFRGHACN